MAESKDPAGKGRSPAEIQRDIEATRAELANTVDAIVDRVSPKRVAARTSSTAKARARELRDQLQAKLADARGGGAGAGTGSRPGPTADLAVTPPRETPAGIPAGAAYRTGEGSIAVAGTSRVRTELRVDRVAIAGAAVALLGVLLLRRRNSRRSTGRYRRR